MINKKDLTPGTILYNYNQYHTQILKIISKERTKYYKTTHSQPYDAITCVDLSATAHKYITQIEIRHDEWNTQYEIRNEGEEFFLYQPKKELRLESKDLIKGFPPNDALRVFFKAIFKAPESHKIIGKKVLDLFL